ncbi:MAG TPA: serine hydrolase domain-containing protein [Planctomycetota bacterium]|nr:serine hydrolase domain-containing protein [Planctomycetota bacterium]
MRALALILSLALAPALAAQDPDPRFPRSTALAERISPEGLAGLSDLVQSFVDADEVVGAELLVIVNGRTILHEGYGWRDRERGLPLQPGGVFCVRSMTKPLIGAAVWMLIEERKLSLDDRVAEHLPAFDVDGKREITILQLLTHSSGLPMSLIMSRDPRTLESLRAVADLGGDCELEFEPGTDFHYSDQGTDTLTAVVAVVTGAPAEEFVRARLLEPLGMADSTCLMSAGHPLRERACSAYMGARGTWTRYWSPEDEALFPIFLGSQALYASASDYARFLDLYLQRGRLNGERLLRSSSVRRTLRPGPFEMGGSTALPGLRADYGMLMQVWTRAGEDGEREPVAFGHTGSDGTHAWAFPEQQAMVLYFTQSRGTATGQRVEERLGELLLGVPYDPLQAAPPLEEYLGYYWEGEGDLYRAIVRDGDELALEIVGRAVVPLDYIGEDRWKLRPQPSTVLAFDRDAEGAVVGYHIGEHVEHRFTPRADMPSADEVAARVAAAHRLERLADAGVVCLRGRIEIPKLGRSGESRLWLQWPDRWRVDEVLGEEVGSVAFDGTALRRASTGQPAAPLEGRAAELVMLRDPFLRFGDWRRDGAELTVVQELRSGDDLRWLVRGGDCSAPAPTMYVDAATGRLERMDGLTFIDGLGVIGQRVTFDDWRDVGGALLPLRIEVELAHALIGTIRNTYEAFETGVEIDAGWFRLDPDAR